LRSGAKGSQIGFDLLVDLSDRRVHGIDLLQMEAQQEAMMRGHTPAQRFAQFPGRSLEPAMGQSRQCSGVAFAGDQRLDHGAATHADHIGDDRVQLDVGVLVF